MDFISHSSDAPLWSGGMAGVCRIELPRWRLGIESQVLIGERHFSETIICYCKVPLLRKKR